MELSRFASLVAGDGIPSTPVGVCGATVTILVRMLPKSTCCEPGNMCCMIQTNNPHTYLTKDTHKGVSFVKSWLREMDLNHRPSGYEPDELPGCSIPR